ncbi:16S rRNA (guanine(966)-N(2))-methyltransferase RsmD [Oceanobacillus halophilus]|uniref:16S rRNA (Guanine(966)-N(2))-methyltransferase RsmD n=1 Tax=Oceanobacillus halophilus TaxID=930130 RepID=A0A495ABI5_9BACI|nr:16S rRNA (guanine(966)-N(2))-methyltransferase RsmD [Oceanobacillus halophilus]RKQ37379.1 16S rRNA (guanine(966)-N(2))-methyltransferase RsmD [Oceanobacillus halophilus]
MRVIAGEFKGRQLKSVPGKSTRPTTDKVKEAVFQVLGPFFNGGKVLDLFAGSGSLGVEAISRGIESGVFVDKHPKAIHTIKENIKTCKLEDKVEVFRTDAFQAVKASAKRGLVFDLIIIDPPYGKVNYVKLINQIIQFNLINEDGLIYCEHDPKEDFNGVNENLNLLKQDNYGGTIGITIYQKN